MAHMPPPRAPVVSPSTPFASIAHGDVPRSGSGQFVSAPAGSPAALSEPAAAGGQAGGWTPAALPEPAAAGGQAGGLSDGGASLSLSVEESIAERWRRLTARANARPGGRARPARSRQRTEDYRAVRRRQDPVAHEEAARAAEVRYASPEFLANMDECGSPPPAVSSEVLAAIRSDVQARLWGNEMDERVCGVCDRLVVVAQVTWQELSGRLLGQVLRRLRLPDDLPADLRAQYDCSTLAGLPALAGLGLSPRGVRMVGERPELAMCVQGCLGRGGVRGIASGAGSSCVLAFCCQGV